jgi:uncharacterized protein (TIGR02452 family)
MNRSQRAQVAAETLAIMREGRYTAPSGADVAIADSIRRAVDGTQLITPDEARDLRTQADQVIAQRSFVNTVVDVRNEGSFTAARRLVPRYGSDGVAVLNFASAKNPGGGFLGGSQAQEEALTRASALYLCLEAQPRYYQAHRREKSLLYTDHLIVSPKVPVFRDEHDQLLEQPWEATIITAPAPNAGAVRKNEPAAVDQIEPTFRRRIEHILAAAVLHGQTALVLGGWGCGVFQNDPTTVATLFAHALRGDGPFARAFEHVTFAVLDSRGETFAAFARVFG